MRAVAHGIELDVEPDLAGSPNARRAAPRGCDRPRRAARPPAEARASCSMASGEDVMPRSASRAASRPGLRGATDLDTTWSSSRNWRPRRRRAKRRCRPRGVAALGIELAQHRGGRGGGDRAEHGARVPALAVMLVLVAARSARPTPRSPRHRPRSWRLPSAPLTLCLAPGSRAPASALGWPQSAVSSIVEHVRGDARRAARSGAAPACRQAGGCANGCSGSALPASRHDARHRLAPARDDDRDAIGEARFDDRNGGRRYPRRRHVGDKTSDLGGQTHGSPPTTFFCA